MDYNNLDNNFHQQYGSLLLTKYQVDILNKYNIDYNEFSCLNELIYYLEDYLNDHNNEELDNLSDQLSEFNYYHNTNK